MLRSPLQGLKNKHVECSLQQLDSVLILVLLVRRCRHSTPTGGRLSTSFCTAQAIRSVQLPKSYPNDPQDRIIGATALVEGIRLLTHDKLIVKSGLIPLAE